MPTRHCVPMFLANYCQPFSVYVISQLVHFSWLLRLPAWPIQQSNCPSHRYHFDLLSHHHPLSCCLISHSNRCKCFRSYSFHIALIEYPISVCRIVQCLSLSVDLCLTLLNPMQFISNSLSHTYTNAI